MGQTQSLGEIEVRDPIVRFREGGEDVIPNAVKKRQLRAGLPAILHEAVRFPAAIVRGKEVEIAGLARIGSDQGRGQLVVLRRQLVRTAVGGQIERICPDRGGALHVACLPANQAQARLDVVVAPGPTDGAGVLEGVVDVLKRNIGTVADIPEGPDRDRRQGVGERTERGHARGKAHRLIGADPVVEREREIVDASKGGPEVEHQARVEEVGEAEGILLGRVGRGTVEVVPAAADLQSIHDPEIWRREGIDLVICEAPEEQIPVVEPVVDPGVIGKAVLGLVRADRKVVRQVAVRRRRKQLQVVQRNRIDRATERAVGRGEQRLRGASVDAVDVVILREGRDRAGIGDPGNLP